jgi:hypothetical protein
MLEFVMSNNVQCVRNDRYFERYMVKVHCCNI